MNISLSLSYPPFRAMRSDWSTLSNAHKYSKMIFVCFLLYPQVSNIWVHFCSGQYCEAAVRTQFGWSPTSYGFQPYNSGVYIHRKRRIVREIRRILSISTQRPAANAFCHFWARVLMHFRTSRWSTTHKLIPNMAEAHTINTTNSSRIFAKTYLQKLLLSGS